MPKVFLGLGTNIGDRKENLQKALNEIEELGIKILKQSSIYETEPIGVTGQQWFYNMVIECKTDLLPEQLLKKAKQIEEDLGREPSRRWGPRLIDIDLLLYDDLEVDKAVESGYLRVPHDQLQNRAFVIKPLLEIWPQAKLPNGEYIRDFLKCTKEQTIRKL